MVTLELGVFAMIVGYVAWMRGAEAEAFRLGQRGLSPSMGLALTLSLLVSGWLAAEGVHAFREARISRARACLVGAVLSGAGFVALKVADYRAKAAAGHGLGGGEFWDTYVLATGFHLVHVLVGLTLLAAVAWRLGRGSFEDPETAVAGSALFWHMCDLVWFFLFPLFFARV